MIVSQLARRETREHEVIVNSHDQADWLLIYSAGLMDEGTNGWM